MMPLQPRIVATSDVIDGVFSETMKRLRYVVVAPKRATVRRAEAGLLRYS
jgi:hypothetical protein